MVGAFCLFESMATLLPFVTDMTILDYGSTDGTLDILADIAGHNSRVEVIQVAMTWPEIDAGAFATVANDCVSEAKHDTVLFWQADEIWHPKLLLRMQKALEEGANDLIFWRYQLRDNFQHMKWFPHPVHRIGPKSDFVFVGDGMNTNRVYGVPICSEHSMARFTEWGGMDASLIPVEDMIMDVSQVGGFRDNIPGRRALHAPMWHEDNKIEGTQVMEWIERESKNPDWTKTKSPFKIPHIMNRHVGRVKYTLDEDLYEALKKDDTIPLVFGAYTA